MHINDLLKIATERRASDLHLKVGGFPIIRVSGHLMALSELSRLSQEDTIAMAFSIMSGRQKQKFKDHFEIDLAYSVPGLGRFRVNIFQQRGTVGLVLRVIPSKILTVEELMMPPVLKTVADERRGLILVTGTTGSGKSTSLAADDRLHQHTRTEHIMTIEDPIEFLHRDKKSLVNQREVEVDTKSFSSALRSALRQDPDVILAARCATTRPSRRRSTPPRPATWSSRPCTPGRHRDHQPDHLRLPAAPAEADQAPAGGGPEVGHLDAPPAARRRHRTGARGRGHADDELHPRLHREQGQDEDDPRGHRAGHVAIRHADVRPVDLPALQARPHHPGSQ